RPLPGIPIGHSSPIRRSPASDVRATRSPAVYGRESRTERHTRTPYTNAIKDAAPMQLFKRLGMYWKYSTRSLARGGQRTLLAIFCVAVGVLAIVALQLVGNMINVSLTGNVREGNGGDLSIRSDVDPVLPTQLSFFDQLKQQGSISSYTAVSD